MKQRFGMPSKYEKPVLETLDSKEYKSTNSIRAELEKKMHKTISWYLIDKSLRNLEARKEIKKIESKRITLWRKV